jgi:hypothetical protein
MKNASTWKEIDDIKISVGARPDDPPHIIRVGHCTNEGSEMLLTPADTKKLANADARKGVSFAEALGEEAPPETSSSTSSELVE